MNEEAVATAPVKVDRRCEGCWDIKRHRARALAAGDMQEAAALTTAMGVHLRVAHEYP
ncbi:hypothetical protein [Streptomyces netropsis]|uniref:Uncharacterized protein n=1 Tax=Streptomyces netropsis TaxID=55404 RepID=A0A7W7L9C5_STRNE|nr:hypothetical protein [Streptomyces netropsis]MBB4886020.1 hypothetical protein [Streptomyces netropsis]GGR17197.1 hypothetical protein GCM10010219_22700 [Streptomyces netropsis]